MRRHTIPLALAAALLITTAATAADDTIRKGFNVADGGTLRLDADIGDVTIVSGGSGVAVEIVRKARGRKARSACARTDRFQAERNDVVIDSDFNGDDAWSNWRASPTTTTAVEHSRPVALQPEVKTSAAASISPHSAAPSTRGPPAAASRPASSPAMRR